MDRFPPVSARSAQLCAALLAGSLLVPGCTPAGEPPPLALSYRDAVVGAGRILRLENTSDRTLEQVEVRIESPQGEARQYTEERIGPHGVVEVGWKRLGGWEILPGARVEIRCRGFRGSLRDTVPETEA